MSPAPGSSQGLLPPLTRNRLTDLTECPRRFWLKAVASLRWPATPLPSEVEKGIQLGQKFHQMMQRAFSGLPRQHQELALLNTWWEAWQKHGLDLPPGQRLPEVTLTTLLEGERLLARYDLLVLPARSGERIMIVDWKTEHRPRARAELAADIQSDLYPFVLTEGGAALMGERAVADLSPDRIDLVYWQANDPLHPVRFRYSPARHASNRSHLAHLVGLARRVVLGPEPPINDDLTSCARCRYPSYCGLTISPDLAPGDDEPLEPSSRHLARLEPDR